MAKKQAPPLHRPPISQMSDDALHTWIRTTREAVQRKMAREQAYLDRRAARGTHAPTDDAIKADQELLADLLARLDEMAASLSPARGEGSESVRGWHDHLA